LTYKGDRIFFAHETQVKTIWSVLLSCFELELISPFPETDRNAMILGVKGKLIVLYKQ
jgi:sterol 14-demethylase